MATLSIWMNGELVGEWTSLRTGTPLLRYAPSWAQSPNARALSLSLPLTADLEVRGPVVDHYFDNLLPDNPDVRRRIRERFKTRSTQPFDLLEAIGRDCVGAVQLLPPGETPDKWNRVEATKLTEPDIEKLLAMLPEQRQTMLFSATMPGPIGSKRSVETRFALSGWPTLVTLPVKRRTAGSTAS